MPEDNNQYPPYTPPQPSPTPSSQPEPQPQPYQTQPTQPQPVTQYPVETQELAAVEKEAPTQSQNFFATPAANEQPVVGASAPVVENQVPPTKPTKKKKLIIAGIITAAALILGGGAYAAYALWYQNPEKVLTDAMSNVIKAKTVTYRGTLAVDTKDVKVRVAFDGKQASQLNGEGNAKMTLTANGKDFTVNGSALVDKDGNLFFKVGNLKAIIDDLMKQSGMTSSPFDDLVAKIDNKWIRVSADDLAEYSKDASKAQACLTDTMKKIQDDKAVQDGLVKAYKDNKFVVIDSSLPGRTVGGVDSMGYELSLNKDAAKKFAEAVNEMQFMKDLQKCDSSLESFKLDTSDVTSPAGDDSTEKVEVSVSRWTHEFTQLKLTGKDKDASGEFIVEPSFGKAVTVAAPTDFMSLKELQAEVQKATESFGSMMGETQVTSSEMDVQYESTSEIDVTVES